MPTLGADLTAVGRLICKQQNFKFGKRIGSGTKTLIHELAHEMLHQHLMAGLLPRQTVELQAESVAYVVARHFGLEPAGSPNYLALWGAEGKDIRATLTTIQRAAAEIIGAVEGAAANA